MCSLGRLQASLEGGGAGVGGASPAGATLLRALAQLMVEFEHFAGDTLTPDALLALAARAGEGSGSGANGVGAAGGGGGGGGDVFPTTLRSARPGEALRVGLHVSGRAGVVYEVLQPLAIPFVSLGLARVVTALLDGLQVAYRALDAAPARDLADVPHAADVFARMDRRVHKHFIAPITSMLARAAYVHAARHALRADAPLLDDGGPPPLLGDLLAAGAALRQQAADTM